MKKSNNNNSRESKLVTNVTTPSFYGSHKSMVVQDLGEKVVCEDNRGCYETFKSRLDNGLADPARNSGRRF